MSGGGSIATVGGALQVATVGHRFGFQIEEYRGEDVVAFAVAALRAFRAIPDKRLFRSPRRRRQRVVVDWAAVVGEGG